MTDPVPLMDSRRRSRMVHLLALFLIAIAVGFLLHWAGYRLISNGREELSGFKLPRRRLSKGWNAYVERKRRLEENGGPNDKAIDQLLMDAYVRGGKGRRKEEADVLVPEVVHWKSFRKQFHLGHENRTRWRPQFDQPKERRARIREHLEMERRRRFEMKIKSKEEQLEGEGVQKTRKGSLKDDEEDVEGKTAPSLSPDNNEVEEATRRESIETTKWMGLRFIRSTEIPTYPVNRLSEAPGPAPRPASVKWDEDIESTSRIPLHEAETRHDQETIKPTSVIPDVDEVRSMKMKPIITKGSSQKIWRSTEPIISSTSEEGSSTRATSSEPEDELIKLMSSLHNKASQKPKEASTKLASTGEGLSLGLTSDKPQTQRSSKSPKSSDEVEVETSSFHPEAILGSNSSETNSTSEIHLLSKPTFSWLMNNESICKLDESINGTRLLAILVLSTRHAYGSRQAIRNSWGSLTNYTNWQIRVVFLLGDTPATQEEEEGEMLSKKLQKEQNTHGDLIMGNFMDTPRNLTLKHLMGLKWILEFCQNVSFVMKVDDNIFLNTMAFVDARNTEIEQASSVKLGFPRPADLYCRLRKNVKPEEDPAEYEKWLEKMYPDFCHRWAYGASLPSIQKLYSVSGKVDLKLKVWTDDVFVTGILRKAAFREYNWLPKIGIITDYTSLDSVEAGYGQQMALIRDLCKNGEWDKNWPVNSVTYLKREEDDQGNVLDRDMRCVWGKILYDTKGRTETKSRKV